MVAISAAWLKRVANVGAREVMREEATDCSFSGSCFQIAADNGARHRQSARFSNQQAISPLFHMTTATAIGDLLENYRTAPLRLMREIGLQSRLHSLLQSNLKHETCRVQVRMGGLPPHLTTFAVERVQMEVRVTNAAGHGPEKSDIVVLRSTDDPVARPITATRYPNGPFDIVSKLDLIDVAEVVEIKASCSADFRERHKSRRDLNKLLLLAETVPDTVPRPSLHFVLVDKSVGVGGNGYGAQPLPDRMPVRDWNVESESFLAKQTQRSRQLFWEDLPGVTLLDEPPTSGGFVQVWQLNHMNGVATVDAPLLRFAVRG